MAGATIGDKVLEMVAKIGEKIDVVNYVIVHADAVVPYIHGNYRLGVLVGLNQEQTDAIVTAGKDVAMQIAAMNPMGIDANDISEEAIAREKAIAIEQIVAEGKPADMAEKIAAAISTSSQGSSFSVPSTGTIIFLPVFSSVFDSSWIVTTLDKLPFLSFLNSLTVVVYILGS